MADYHSLIARAVAALPQSTPDARQAVYERARKALFNQLRGIQPPVAEEDIAAEGRALDEAIARVEAESAAKQAQAPQPGAGASAPHSIRSAPPAQRAPAENEESNWRDAPYSPGASRGREFQRPPAPLPPAPRQKRSLRLTLSIAGVVVALVAIVGTLAWQLREQPEDLAKLKPEQSAASAPESGKINDRVGGQGTAVKQVAPRGPAVPVAQKAEMWVGSLTEPTKVDRIYNGSVVWRLENVGGPGEPIGSAIRGDIDIPDAKLKMSLLFRKNTDATLSASHTINVSFSVAPGSPIGGVKAIGPIQMRRSDAQSGEKVVGIPVPITENNFLIGLMRGDHESRNILLLRSLTALDLPMQLADGRAATINMEKGPSGERVFADAIDAWGK
ncbi:MAG: hypothetical protein FJX45_16965 [Alphaproteobacteria bacterium]|nr:hypothetical protein [Alphaproteobacteria bacterium]MBM3653259.1 hypothetical protein [Alphaproteobacteria bacterium]